MPKTRLKLSRRPKRTKAAKARKAYYAKLRAKAKSASSESHPVDSIAFVDIKSEIEVKEEDLTDYLCSNSSQNTVVKENENLNKIKNVADSFQEKTAETEKIVVYEILDSFLHSEKSKQEEDNKDECLEADFFVSSNKNWCSKTYHRSNASTNPTHIGALSTQEYHRRDDKPRESSRVCSCHFPDGKKENLPQLFQHNVEKKIRKTRENCIGKMVMCWAPACRHYNVRDKCRFFRFPKDAKEREKWEKLLRRDVKPGPGAFVCSCHFRDGNKANGPELFVNNVKKQLEFSTPGTKPRRARLTPSEDVTAEQTFSPFFILMDNENVNNIQLSPPKKRPRKHISVEEKQTVMNAFKVCEEQHPEWKKEEKVESVARSIGIGLTSVYKILREHKEHHEYFDAPRAYNRSRAILDNVSEEDKNSIRRIVHDFFLRNEPPTLDKILIKVNENEDLPNFKRTTLAKLLKEINFRNYYIEKYNISECYVVLNKLSMEEVSRISISPYFVALKCGRCRKFVYYGQKCALCQLCYHYECALLRKYCCGVKLFPSENVLTPSTCCKCKETVEFGPQCSICQAKFHSFCLTPYDQCCQLNLYECKIQKLCNNCRENVNCGPKCPLCSAIYHIGCVNDGFICCGIKLSSKDVDCRCSKCKKRVCLGSPMCLQCGRVRHAYCLHRYKKCCGKQIPLEVYFIPSFKYVISYNSQFIKRRAFLKKSKTVNHPHKLRSLKDSADLERAKEKSTNESHPVDNIAIVGIKSEFELKEEVTDDVTERQEFVSTPEPSSSFSGIFVENNEDTLKNLFDFLYNVVKKFPPNLQSQVKIDLFKVVTEAEMKLQCNDAA